MFDIYLEGVNLTPIVAIAGLVLMLPLQLLLCFKAKRVIVRLIPAAAFAAAGIALYVAGRVIGDMAGLGLFIFAVYAAFMLFTCGFGWGLWAIARGFGKIKHN